MKNFTIQKSIIFQLSEKFKTLKLLIRKIENKIILILITIFKRNIGTLETLF